MKTNGHAVDGTFASLISAYRKHPASGYRALRHRTRVNYDGMCNRLDREVGAKRVADTQASTIRAWHQGWSQNGQSSMAHGLVQMIRKLINFGIVQLENDDCRGAGAVMHSIRIKVERLDRPDPLTAEQVEQIRATAHDLGYGSIALAQALQHDCQMHQIEVVGEWIPVTTLDERDLLDGSGTRRWIRGLAWSDLDENSTLRHDGLRGRRIEIDLRKCPMVMEELKRFRTDRTAGPMIVYEATGLPYATHQFRRIWRDIADAVGLPKTMKNANTGPRQLDRKTERDTRRRDQILIAGLQSIRDFRNCPTAEAMAALAGETLLAAQVQI